MVSPKTKTAAIMLSVVAIILGIIASLAGSAINAMSDDEPLSDMAAAFVPSHIPSVAEPPPDSRRDSQQSFTPIPPPVVVVPPPYVVQPPKALKPAPTIIKPKKPVQSVQKVKSSKTVSTTPVPASGTAAEKALAFALAQRGKPYVWGATGPSSYDCSGLVMRAYQSAGISLPRTTRSIISRGTPVSRSALLRGDIVWTSSGHVGIYSGNGKIVHAPQSGDVVKESPIWSFYAARRL